MLIRRRERRDGWVVGYFSDHAAQLVHPRAAAGTSATTSRDLATVARCAVT